MLAERLGAPLLGQVPFVPALREGGDDGRPITAVEPESEAAQVFRSMAERIAVELAPDAQVPRASSRSSETRGCLGETPCRDVRAAEMKPYGRIDGRRRRDAPKGTPVGRRVFIGMLGLGAAGIVWGAKVQSGMERLLRPITLNDRTGLTAFLPTSGRFRIYSVTGSLPSESEAEYRLTIDGLVDKPTTLTLADLRALPQTDLVRDFQCVTGWRVPDVPWVGVKVSDVLDRVGVQSDRQLPPPHVVRR